MPMHGDRPTGPSRAARMAALTPPAALLDCMGSDRRTEG
jgi:hypothetical protein